ncbi:hypothetical protein [Novosphingobium sp. M1R2S20]|uniref:Uncharacterized protein n=1 Tax=Novosphingobium rhizovicinum TaxID=3228928 RepID=A0ABV3RGH2_9SPHN
MTGRAQTASLTKEAFRKEVCSTLPVHMRCADLFVDTRVASNFSSANVSASDLVYDSVSGDLKDTTTYEPGLPGDIVVMRLMYQSSVISGPLGFDLSNMQGDRRLLIATSIFKNETY